MQEWKTIAMGMLGSLFIWIVNKIIAKPLEKIEQHDKDIQELGTGQKVINERLSNMNEDIREIKGKKQ